MSDFSVMIADRYRLESRIAVGGMGEVWRAVDTVLDRPVAVKLLRAEYAGHADTLARFRAEARHAGSLTHPGIARVYDYGETGYGHPPYLVMELVDGPALTALLASGPLDAARTMDVISQAAAALDAAHAAGLVHRDIKPGNLLVAAGGEVKITDFGIAHAAGSASITRTGTLIGTPAYLAPERVTGGSASPASDLYSLGILAWECLTGAPPFSGPEMEVALAHRDLPLPPLPPGLPAEVTALIAELTAKNPAARPVSAGELARRAGRLRDALAGGHELPGGWPGMSDDGLPSPKTATLATHHAMTLTGEPLPDLWLDRPRPRGRRQVVRRWLVAAAAVAVTAGLAGWLLTDGFSPAAAHRHEAAGPAATASKPADTVAVSSDALVGQPVRYVRRQLNQLGLRVQVNWQPSEQQPPRTVLSVQPTGQVRAGSTIVLTVAFPSFGHHRHDHGNGGGNGNGNGNGDGGD
ncbi:MAG: protein kinase domain-containing protein [Streptosporangiaceae bacterium]